MRGTPSTFTIDFWIDLCGDDIISLTQDKSTKKWMAKGNTNLVGVAEYRDDTAYDAVEGLALHSLLKMKQEDYFNHPFYDATFHAERTL